MFINFNAAPVSNWNKLPIDGLTIGKGEIKPEDLYAAIKKKRAIVASVSRFALSVN